MSSPPSDHPVPDLDALVRARVLPALAGRPRGLLSDLDGTLSAIAPTPEAAVPLPGVAELLRAATARFDLVAIISGRSAVDARSMVGVPGLWYVGNHGMEWLGPGDDAGAPPHVLTEAALYADEVADALDELEATLGSHWPGMRVERKGATGSVHVRATSDPPAALEAVTRGATVAAVRRGLRVTTGKLVVEIRPPVDVDKGSAVTALVRDHGLRSVLYLGDDRTDLDAFRALRALTDAHACRACAVAVLHPEAPPELAAAADLSLPSARAVPGFLRALLAVV
jgi:trehalose 6-phosphate phosphatase